MYVVASEAPQSDDSVSMYDASGSLLLLFAMRLMKFMLLLPVLLLIALLHHRPFERYLSVLTKSRQVSPRVIFSLLKHFLSTYILYLVSEYRTCLVE